MGRTGFVLAGGESTRMGADKALLSYRGTTLIEHIAGAVQEAAGNCTLIADPSRYSALKYAICADKQPFCGPLGGLFTALSVTFDDWNLVVACDMPGISVTLLRSLLHQAESSHHDCVAVAGTAGEPEPLCAVYHRRSLPVVERAILDKRLKMKELVAELGVVTVSAEVSALWNVNTPAEWARFVEESK